MNGFELFRRSGLSREQPFNIFVTSLKYFEKQLSRFSSLNIVNLVRVFF